MAKILDLNKKNDYIKFAKEVFNGAIFVYPTESVFGLGCDINNKNAIERVLSLKRRDVCKGLIVISDNFEKIKYLIDIKYHQVFIENYKTDVPTTWICPASKRVLSEITGGTQKIALRITENFTCIKICKILNAPIISTSANKSGEKPFIKYDDILNNFYNDVDYIIKGNVGNSKKPSRIIDLLTKDILREGG